MGAQASLSSDSDSAQTSSSSDIDTSHTKSSAEDAEDLTAQETEEDFNSWIQRATGLPEQELEKAHLEDWVAQQRRSYWRWAGHTCRRTDNRWAVKVWKWTPEDGGRPVGHPKKRWIDELSGYAESCQDLLQQRRLKFMMRHCGEGIDTPEKESRSINMWRKLWKQHEESFVNQA